MTARVHVRVQEPDRAVGRHGAQVHVPFCGGEILMARAGAPRIARCEQNVCRGRW